MEINLSLDGIIGEREKEVLFRVLNCQTDEELTQKFNRISMAAICEYLEMILGKQLPTRANEIRERRLYHLLKHYFQGYFPNEAEVSSIFQLTESDSRSLLRNVRTKFKFELETELLNTIREILRNASQQDDGNYRVVISSDNILEELKQKVSIIAIELDQIQKVKNSAGVYNIPEDTYSRLVDAYSIGNGELEVAAVEE